MMNRISRRSFGALSLGTVATVAGARFVVAQDATPAADAPATIFEGMTDLQPVDVTVNDMIVKASIAGCFGEGWYVFNITNEGTTAATVNIGQVPEGVSVGDLTSAVTKAFKGAGGELPEWWTTALFAGGASVDAGTTKSVIVNLTAGQWVLFNTYALGTQSPATFQVNDEQGLIDTGCAAPAEDTGTPMASPVASPVASEAPEGLPVGMTIEVNDTAFVATAMPIPGTLVLGVKNTGTQPHDLVVLKMAEAVDPAAATSVATSWIKGEETGATVAGGVGALSAGKIAYTEIMVEAGSYLAFSTMPDVAGGLQVDKGLVLPFTV